MITLLSFFLIPINCFLSYSPSYPLSHNYSWIFFLKYVFLSFFLIPINCLLLHFPSLSHNYSRTVFIITSFSFLISINCPITFSFVSIVRESSSGLHFHPIVDCHSLSISPCSPAVILQLNSISTNSISFPSGERLPLPPLLPFGPRSRQLRRVV